MNIPVNNTEFNGIVLSQSDGRITATSRDIAEKFGKAHKRVLQSIRELDCSPEFSRHHFVHTPYVDVQNGQTYQMYNITLEGFMFLAMGFTGKAAAAWKEKFIAAFNAMAAKLKQSTAVLDLNSPSQLRGLLSNYAERTEVAEAKVLEFEPKAVAFDRLDTAEGDFTVRPASKVLGFPERKLTKWFQLNRWAFRSGGKGPLQAYVEKRNCGYLDHRLDRYKDNETGEWKTRIQMVVTPKGMARLAKLLPLVGGAA